MTPSFPSVVPMGSEAPCPPHTRSQMGPNAKELFRLVEDFVGVIGFRMKDLRDAYQVTDNLGEPLPTLLTPSPALSAALGHPPRRCPCPWEQAAARRPAWTLPASSHGHSPQLHVHRGQMGSQRATAGCLSPGHSRSPGPGPALAFTPQCPLCTGTARRVHGGTVQPAPPCPLPPSVSSEGVQLLPVQVH